jgi:hypothetical protein
MTPFTNTARIAKITPNADAAENLLRDMAYVLKLTRRVKEEMTADRARTESPAARTAEGALVA